MDYSIYRKVLLMVSELHVRGYQQIRIAPGESPSGLHWRCTITPVINILKSNGAKVRHWDDDLCANYSSGQERNYFGWGDVGYLTPSKMANLFIKHFPRIVEVGKGSDWLYVGWYVEMLHLTYPDRLPVAYGEYFSYTDSLPVIGGKGSVTIPLPPPGLAEDDTAD